MLSPTQLCSAIFLLLLAIGAPGFAFAKAGVAEINPACAVTTGCFPGDTPGYPVTIDGSAGPHYRLTGSLILPSRATTGIFVETNNVSIDLGGFSIAYAGCDVVAGVCDGTTGSGSGVFFNYTAELEAGWGVSVFNGSIVGMGQSGIFLFSGDKMSDLKLRLNGGSGLRLEVGGVTVERVQSFDNGEDGIVVGLGSHVRDSVAARNGSHGIFAGSGSDVIHCASYSNERGGIHIAADNNFLHGGGSLQESLIKGNRTGPSIGAEIGIGSGVVSHNVILLDQPADYALQLGDGALVESNVIWSAETTVADWNTKRGYRGNVYGAGVTPLSSTGNLGANLCDATVCP